MIYYLEMSGDKNTFRIKSGRRGGKEHASLILETVDEGEEVNAFMDAAILLSFLKSQVPGSTMAEFAKEIRREGLLEQWIALIE